MATDYFLRELDFDLTNPVMGGEALIEKFGVQYVHYSGEYPAILIKTVKNFNQTTLTEIAEVHRKVWNDSSITFLYVVSPMEIRIYNCNALPIFLERPETQLSVELSDREVERCTTEDLEKLKLLKSVFSSFAIDTGRIWTSDYSKKIKLQTKVDHYLVDSLLRLAKRINTSVDDDELIHGLLMRSIFIMYLQDRKAIPKEIWEGAGGTDFIEILKDKKTTYWLFSEIEEHFNGNIFPVLPNEYGNITLDHLKLVRQCLIDGTVDEQQNRLFTDWRLFDFSYIRIELLSEIYESFLNQFDPVRKRQMGAFYTPPSLVKLVLDNVLPKESTNYNIRVLDPACGSGIFLALAYKRIVGYWKNANPGEEPNFSILAQLLQDCIYGVELDKNSIRVAAFSLYLTLLDFLEPRNVWLKNGECFPYLIDYGEQPRSNRPNGNNLFRTDTLLPDGAFEQIQYDYILGNPPFGTKNLPKNVHKFCAEHGFDKQFVIPFIYKSTLLSKHGKIGLLFNTKILTNRKDSAQNFRDWLFGQNYVEKIHNLSILRKAPKNFGGQLFSSATVPVSIVYFQATPPENSSPNIEYWAPKTFVKNHVVEGVVTDSTDLKYIPRELCDQQGIQLWKIAHWGGLADFRLLNRLKSGGVSSLEELFDRNNTGVGLQTLDGTTRKPILDDDIPKLPYVVPQRIRRFYTHDAYVDNINKSLSTENTRKRYLAYYNKSDVQELPLINVFRRTGKKKAYQGPHVLIKEGLSDNKVCASFFDRNCSFNSKVIGIHHTDATFLKALTCYINSALVTYILFMETASWGVEREEIKPGDIYDLPEMPESLIGPLHEFYDQLKSESQQILQLPSDTEARMNLLIAEHFRLTPNEKILIEDFHRYTLPLFTHGEKSISLKPLSLDSPEVEEYTKMVCAELNTFLGDQGKNVTGKAYRTPHNVPISVTVLQFIDGDITQEIAVTDFDGEFEEILKSINQYTIKENAKNIYVQKIIKYYDGDTIFILKPNQKRFWTRSQGIEDAGTIINEIIAASVYEG